MGISINELARRSGVDPEVIRLAEDACWIEFLDDFKAIMSALNADESVFSQIKAMGVH